MDIVIQNCNNIDHGEILLREGTLNIKYAINGTGKSTIAKAISAAVLRDQQVLLNLLPYKYISQPEDNSPAVAGVDDVHSMWYETNEFL